MLDVRALSWLAGFLEGEGCFSFIGPNENHPRRREWRVEVSSTDEDVIIEAARFMDAPISGPFKSARKKPFWRASLSRRKDVIALIKELRPYMGKRRQARIDFMLKQNEVEPPRRKPGRQIED